MARALTLAVFCLCLAITYAADLRRLIAERASADPYAAQAAKTGADGKPAGDLDTAHSWGWGGPGFGGPWGGWGPWGYGYGGYGGYGGWGGGWGGGYGGWW